MSSGVPDMTGGFGQEPSRVPDATDGFAFSTFLAEPSAPVVQANQVQVLGAIGAPLGQTNNVTSNATYDHNTVDAAGQIRAAIAGPNTTTDDPGRKLETGWFQRDWYSCLGKDELNDWKWIPRLLVYIMVASFMYILAHVYRLVDFLTDEFHETYSPWEQDFTWCWIILAASQLVILYLVGKNYKPILDLLEGSRKTPPETKGVPKSVIWALWTSAGSKGIFFILLFANVTWYNDLPWFGGEEGSAWQEPFLAVVSGVEMTLSTSAAMGITNFNSYQIKRAT